MRKLIIASLILIGPYSASATTKYFIKGKEVSKGQALIQSLQDPRIKVLKVQVNYVQANQVKATLRKVADAPLSDIPK